MIGILAGMGPKSTGPFIDLVVEHCQNIYGAKDDMDFPPMMIYSCPTPFTIGRPIDHAAMEKAIIDGAQKLEGTGVAFLAMPCNTAHLYYQQIQQSLSIPLLNMVEETIKSLPSSAKRVALLATHATVQSGVYQDALIHAGLDYVQKEAWQAKVSEIISLIKAGRLEEATLLWHQLSAEMVDTVDTVVMACTDLNVITRQLTLSHQYVDSAACLARSLVNRYLMLIR